MTDKSLMRTVSACDLLPADRTMVVDRAPSVVRCHPWVGALGVCLVAIGGGAVGYYALGGGAWGIHALGAHQQDPDAMSFFERYLGSWVEQFSRRR